MNKQEIFFVGLSVFLALAGLGVEYLWECSNGFSRSGSLIVCVGIYLELPNLKRVIVANYEARVKRLESNRLENDIVFSDKEIKDGVRGATDSVKKQAESAKEKDVQRINMVYAGILGAGTMIWGFGDLVLRSPC